MNRKRTTAAWTQRGFLTVVGALTLIGILHQPYPAGAWCEAMGGYPSYEAQAAAKRLAEEQDKARRSTMENNYQPSEQVKADQLSLKETGFYKGDLDGKVGPVYLSAVTDFRKANGLGNGTTLDAASREILRGGKAVTREQSRQASADQKVLKDLEYYQGEVDGIPGSTTSQAAIANFRKANGLESGTSLDGTSREILHGGKAISRSKADQMALTNLGYYRGDVDGLAGSCAMQTAVIDYSMANGLGGGATLDAANRDLLYGGKAVTKEQHRLGVADQAALKALGYYQGDLDGMMGPAYEAAIADFRKANGLESGSRLDATSRDTLYGGKAITKDQNKQVLADQSSPKALKYYQVDVNGTLRPADAQDLKNGAIIAAGPVAEKLYAGALALFSSRNYDQATANFQNFVTGYPDHRLAGNAQYWIGECQYSQKRYTQAAVEFAKVEKVYPTSPKIPAALLKMGRSLWEVKETSDAQAALQRILDKYPQSEEAAKAREQLDRWK